MSHKWLYRFTNLFLMLIVSFIEPGLAFAADGDLDPTFDLDGIVSTDFDKRGDFGYAVALQPDGKIVMAGTSSDYSGICCNHDFALARYNSDGSLDSSFDADGMVITGFGNTAFGSTHESGYAVTIQPDSKIVVAGASTAFSSSGGNSDFALARYNSDGSLDTTFDTDGKVTTDFGTIYDHAFSVGIQPDGKIVASGGSYLKLAMARYNSDGSLDPTFDQDGKVILDFGSGENYGGTLALQQDGKIILAGQTFIYQVGYVFAVARYDSSGSLDTTFNTDGKVTTDFVNSFDDGIGAVAIQADGKIVAAGGSDLDSTANSDFALARYNSDGSLDTTFDNDGKVTTEFGSLEDIASAVAIQQDGRIITAGRTNSGSSADFALARYTSDGSLDTTFDTDGKLTTAIGDGEDYAYAIVLQPNGKIIVAGSSNLLGGNDYDFALARYDVTSAIEVTLDIKPGSQTNPINPKSAGKIPVAILSTPDFNAVTEIDRTSLTFGSTGDEHSLISCNKGGTDVNGDGLKDLVCHFKTKLTGFKSGDMEGILKGLTLTGVPIEARDVVKVLQASYP